jgi:hypothetical protein
VIHVWFFPTVSHDGYAFREGFWCHRVIRTFAWGAARAMAELSVPLTGSWPADDEGDPDGDASGDDMSGRIEPQPAFLDSLQDLGHESAPYAPVRTRDPVPQPDRAPDPHATSTHPAGR